MNIFLLFIFLFFFSTKSFCIQNFYLKDFIWNIKNKFDIYLYKKILLNHLGNIISKKNIIDIVNCLYKTRYFKNIKIYEVNNKLFIYLNYKPLIYDLLIQGNISLNSKKILFILDKFNIKKNFFLENNLILEVKKIFLNKYKELGKYNVKISFLIFFLNKKYCILKINFNEGEYLKIKNISFKRNSFLNKEKILYLKNVNNNFKLLNYFVDFNFYNLINDLYRIKNFYFKYGYLDFYFKKIKFIFLNKNILNIIIDLYEGDRYKIYDILFKKKIKDIKLNKILDKIKWKFFNKNIYYKSTIIDSIILNIKKEFKKCGFLNFKININYKKLVNNKIIFFLYIKLNKIFYINKIILKNINSYKNSFLYKNIPIHKNNLYNEYLINLGKKNLENTNIFSLVSWKKKIINSKKNNKLNIIYNFKSDYDNKFNFGINYGNNNNLNYEFNLFKKNFFYLGNDFLIKSTKTKFSNNSKIYTKNFINYLNNFFIKHKLFFNYSLNNQLNNYGYLNKNYGYKSYITWRVNDFLEYNLGLEYIYNIFNKMKPYLGILKYLKSINKKIDFISKKNPLIISDFLINFNFKINKLDNIILPKYGFYIYFNSKFTSFKSMNNFYKIYVSASKYFSLNKYKNWIFFLHNYIGYSNSFNNKIIPFYENFHSLNNNFLRVFSNDISYNQIYTNFNKNKCKKNKYMCLSSYYSGGNFIFYLNNELVFPNFFLNNYYKNYFRTSLFIDSGLVLDTNLINTSNNINNNISDYKNIKNMFKMSAGISCKIVTPLGTINLSYGFPILYNSNDKIHNFQFNIGNFI